MSRKNSNCIIIFSTQENDSNFFGFTIREKQHADSFMKAVKQLEEMSYEFFVNDIPIAYHADDFEVIKINDEQIDILNRIFNIDIDGTVGIFPDPINDAYDAGLNEDEEMNEDF